MIRKFALATAAIAALGITSLTLTSTPASAHHWGGGGYHHFHGGHFGGFRIYTGVGLYDGCLRTRYVVNRYGQLVPRTVNICD